MSFLSKNIKDATKDIVHMYIWLTTSLYEYFINFICKIYKNVLLKSHIYKKTIMPVQLKRQSQKIYRIKKAHMMVET